MSKLDPDLIAAIRFEYSFSTDSFRQIAARHGVSHQTVKNLTEGIGRNTPVTIIDKAKVKSVQAMIDSKSLGESIDNLNSTRVSQKPTREEVLGREVVPIDRLVWLESDSDLDKLKLKCEWYANAGMLIAAKAMECLQEPMVSLATMDMLADVLGKCMKISGTVAFYPDKGGGAIRPVPDVLPSVPGLNEFYQSLSNVGTGNAQGDAITVSQG